MVHEYLHLDVSRSYRLYMATRSWNFAGITPGFWKRREDESWRHYSEVDAVTGIELTPELQTVYRAGVDDGRSVVTGIVVTRTDGQALTARDLRRIRFPPSSRLWAERLEKYGAARRAAPAKPGPKGHPIEHWRGVYDLWEQALRAAPRAPIRWIQQQYEPEVSIATVGRWVKRARGMKEEGNL